MAGKKTGKCYCRCISLWAVGAQKRSGHSARVTKWPVSIPECMASARDRKEHTHHRGLCFQVSLAQQQEVNLGVQEL